MVAVLAVAVAIAVVSLNALTGRAAPRPVTAKPFSLEELGHPGQRVSLADFAGQPVVVNFFGSWCPPCRRETPLLARFYADHHGQIKIIGVDANDQAAAGLRFVRAERVGYPVGSDPFPAETALAYGIRNLPVTFFLNARHQIVRQVRGGVTARELRAWAAGTGRPVSR